MSTIAPTSLPLRGVGRLRSLDRYAGIPLLIALARTRTKRAIPPNPNSFGLLNTAAIGDTLLMSGPVADLRRDFPDASITLFAGPSNYDASRLISGIDSVVRLPVPEIKTTLRLLRHSHFDILMDFGPWPRLNALLTLFAKASFTIGFKTRGEHRHYGYDLAVEHSANVHELVNHRRIVRALGVVSRSNPSLDRHTLPNPTLPSRPYVALHLWAGGSGAHLKEWPLDRWAALASMLADADFEVVLTGSSSQREANQLALSNVPEPQRRKMLNAAGMSLAETASLLAHASLVVSVNTGIMHLAAALDAPLVALHGPTSPGRWGPVSRNAIVVESPLPGAGYLNLGFEFPRRPPKCMEAISYDAVRDACLRHLTTLNHPLDRNLGNPVLNVTRTSAV
jgi:heptosyltransferase-3